MRFLDENDSDFTIAEEFRKNCRDRIHTTSTSGCCVDFVQVNAIFLPQEYSYDFLLFCQRNPKPCPLLEVTSSLSADILAPGSNLYTDIPKYNILEYGEITKTELDVSAYIPHKFSVFLLGCSFSFEQALITAGVPVRHIEENKNVPMYITNIDCRPAGVFSGPLIVTMRPIPIEKLNLALKITSRYPSVHGSPIHKGDPGLIGIKDLSQVDYGDAVTIYSNEIPVFWACGVTPMQAILQAKIPLAVTHAPGHMFITNKLNSSLDISNITFKYESEG